MKLTNPDFLMPMQCRMARAALGLSLIDASKASLVSRGTITRFENGVDIKPVLRAALRAMFESYGLAFTASGVEVIQIDPRLAA